MPARKIREILKELRLVKTFDEAQLAHLNTQWAYKSSTRYRFLVNHIRWIYDAKVFKELRRLPTADELLNARPYLVRSGGKVDPLIAIGQLLQLTVKECSDGAGSIAHLCLMYRLATQYKLIDVADKGDVEILHAIPYTTTVTETKRYISGDFTAYFLNRRYVVLVNRPTGDRDIPDVDKHYMVTAYDLGGVFEHMLTGYKGIPREFAHTRYLKLKPRNITVPTPYTNLSLHFVDTKQKGSRIVWLINRPKSLRVDLFTFGFSPVEPVNGCVVGIHRDDWDITCKQLAIPSKTQLLKEMKCQISRNTVQK